MSAVLNCLFHTYADTLPEDHFPHLVLDHWQWPIGSGSPHLIFFNLRVFFI